MDDIYRSLTSLHDRGRCRYIFLKKWSVNSESSMTLLKFAEKTKTELLRQSTHIYVVDTERTYLYNKMLNLCYRDKYAFKNCCWDGWIQNPLCFLCVFLGLTSNSGDLSVSPKISSTPSTPAFSQKEVIRRQTFIHQEDLREFYLKIIIKKLYFSHDLILISC